MTLEELQKEINRIPKEFNGYNISVMTGYNDLEKVKRVGIVVEMSLENNDSYKK